MTKQYFEVKVKYVKIDENGKEKKVTEPYLFDAVSFTEAEARAHEEFEKVIHSDFIITNISRSNISEIYGNSEGDRFHKATVTFINVDEESGKEKKSKHYMLVEANNVKHAYEFLEECLSDMIVPYETPAISESPIMDVFEYDLEEVAEKWEDPATEVFPKEDVMKFSQVNKHAKIGVDIIPRDEWGNEKY
jgi:hypothetical protein